MTRGLRPRRLGQALEIAPRLGEPDRAFVAEGDRQRLHAVGAAGHRRAFVGLGQPVEFAPDVLEIAHEHRVRLLELQHQAAVEHVLGGRAEVQIFAVAAAAGSLQRAQRRHQRMLDAADFGADRVEVDVGDLGVARDVRGRRLRNDAELGLRQREGGLVVEPLLHAVLVAEDRAQFVGPPGVPEQGGIENTGWHGGSRDCDGGRSPARAGYPRIPRREGP
jgi:hypothetical protein